MGGTTLATGEPPLRKVREGEPHHLRRSEPPLRRRVHVDSGSINMGSIRRKILSATTRVGIPNPMDQVTFQTKLMLKAIKPRSSDAYGIREEIFERIVAMLHGDNAEPSEVSFIPLLLTMKRQSGEPYRYQELYDKVKDKDSNRKDLLVGWRRAVTLLIR